jgi:hypothetical protein
VQAARLLEDPRRVGNRTDRVVHVAQEFLVIVLSTQRVLRAPSLAGPPCPLGGHLDQRDLIAGPRARRCAVDAEQGNPSISFDQRHAHERGYLALEQMCTLCIGEPLVSVDVAHHDGLAAAAGLDHGLAEPLDVISTG